jgi:hypothetical protein
VAASKNGGDHIALPRAQGPFVVGIARQGFRTTFVCAAGAAAVTGVTLLILDQVRRDRSVATAPMVISVKKATGGIALWGQW